MQHREFCKPKGTHKHFSTTHYYSPAEKPNTLYLTLAFRANKVKPQSTLPETTNQRRDGRRRLLFLAEINTARAAGRDAMESFVIALYHIEYFIPKRFCWCRPSAAAKCKVEGVLRQNINTTKPAPSCT